ncbi:MAG: tRNA pseudouridine(38-40) synthase TruA [Acutalibacteraceae bacterium]|jgi:tRNA pseudouridine38-40 synthase
MRNLLFAIAFDGANYHGWQVQTNGISVQETVQDALEKVCGKRENIIGCSRTDAGVHANMYCFNMRTESSISCNRFIGALNANLPEDIAVSNCIEVAYDFHARYHCTSKEYIYNIWNAYYPNPFLTKFSYQYKHRLDEKSMQNQALDFIGKYDYASFCSANSKVRDTVRDVKKFSVERDGNLITLSVEADGFLYNMVRIMIGTLIRIEEDRIPRGSIKSILQSGDRSRAGVTVPAKGLFLNRVNYPEINIES